TGCSQPQPQLEGANAALRVLDEAELWPADRPLRASISAMGFGGINTHVVLESSVAERRHTLSTRERSLSASQQDAELFLLAAETIEELSLQVEKLITIAGRLSRAELTDLAATLQRTLSSAALRAAVVATKPSELLERLRTLQSWLKVGSGSGLRVVDGLFLGRATAHPHIAFLFPGQGSPTHLEGGVWRRKF